MPSHLVIWLAIRAFGLIAMLGLGISVALGLAMSSRLLSRPGLVPKLRVWHEAFTLVTLGLIATHAGFVLFDRYMHPGVIGVTVPFALGYRRPFTGAGVLAAWLAAAFGLSFYVRRQIGPRRWRQMHRFTIVAYLLALTHAVGAGVDGLTSWMLDGLAFLTTPIVLAFGLRMLRPAAARPAHPAATEAGIPV